MNGKRKSEETKRKKKKTLGTTKDIFSLLLYNQCSMQQRAKPQSMRFKAPTRY